MNAPANDSSSNGPPPSGPLSFTRHSRLKFTILLSIAGFCCLLFLALGTWQIERWIWKLDLIERVEQRVHAPPVALPPASEWSQLDFAKAEYRHVSLSGILLNDRETLVEASTKLGVGFWVVTPLRLHDGNIVLINRGFVRADKRERTAHGATTATEATSLTGLLRLSEPKGTLLRRNDPAAERWYSRDVAAIAAARGLSNAAPFFIDANAYANSTSGPVGGLTVVTFYNHHGIYVFTWYVLALICAAFVWYLVREERKKGDAETSPSV